MVIEDMNGKPLTAITVFALCLRYLKEDAVKTVSAKLTDREVTMADIRWVLTVPAIWTDAAKQFMREAAEDKLQWIYCFSSFFICYRVFILLILIYSLAYVSIAL